MDPVFQKKEEMGPLFVKIDSSLRKISQHICTDGTMMDHWVGIRREVILLQTLFITVQDLPQTLSACGNDHRQFWSYVKMEFSTSACNMGSTDCMFMRIHSAADYLAKDISDLANNLKDECLEALEHLHSKAVRVLKFLESELIATCSSSMLSVQKSPIVLQLFEYLIQSLWNLINYKSILLAPKEASVAFIEEKLRFLIVLECFRSEEMPSHFGPMADRLACLSYLFYFHTFNEEDHEMRHIINDNLPRLLQDMLKPVENCYLLYIVNCLLRTLMQLPNLEDQMAILSREVKILNCFIASLPTGHSQNKKLLYHSYNCQHAAFKIVNALYSHLPRIKNFPSWLKSAAEKLLTLFHDQAEQYRVADILELEYLKFRRRIKSGAEILVTNLFAIHMKQNSVAEDLNLEFAGFLREVNVIKKELKDIYPLSIVPFSNSEGTLYIDFFIKKLEEISQTDKFISVLKLDQMETICTGIKSIRSFLKANMASTTEQRQGHSYVVPKDLISRCLAVVYEAELAIESFLASNGPSWISDTMKEIKHLNIEIGGICSKPNLQGTTNYCSETNGESSINVTNEMSRVTAKTTASSVDAIANEVTVGFKDEEEKIVELLTTDLCELDVISIFGMAGLGKTTLANKVFIHKTITRRFDIRLWSPISQEYNKRGLLLSLVSQLNKPPSDTMEMSINDLAHKLRQDLSGKRYLIVLDDVWKTEVWDDLEKYLPEKEESSRILLTSRYEKVALSAKRHSDPIMLRFFTKEESFELLEKRIFPKDECPLGLKKVGKRIAENCRGLPLVTAVLAGILADVDKSIDCWSKVADDSENTSMLDGCKSTIELSFRQLPDYLKPCLIYLAAFPEDREIPVSKLLYLWISERFIPVTDQKTLESVAEEYLKNLLSRSLVIAAKRRSRGGVKTILVHDLIRDFCMAKAKEDCFLNWVNRDHPPNGTYSYCPRLCSYSTAYSKRNHSAGSSNLRSFHFYLKEQIRYHYWRNFLHCLSFVSVLNITELMIDQSELHGLFSLIHLRYLAVKGNRITAIGSQIANLQSLETLILNGSLDISVTSRIWELKKLRHLHIRPSAKVEKGDSPGESEKLSDLYSFSKTKLYQLEDQLQRMPNLQTLKLDMSGKEVPEMAFLTKLESLNISAFWGTTSIPVQCLPENLKKLTLDTIIPWSEISQLAALPHLEVLKLKRDAGEVYECDAGEESEWEMKDGQHFSRLKFLKLDGLYLTRWTGSCNEVFPRLESLVLDGVSGLEEIPPSFSDISNLQMIQVQRCRPSLGQCARDMQKYFEEELGCNGLKVIVSEEMVQDRNEQLHGLDQ